MALLTSEIYRLKAELGWNVLQTGAEPYIGIHPFFDVVVAPYLEAGAVTSSATAIVASTTPALVSLTLSSAVGFSAMARVWVDQDDAQESALVETVNGSVISVRLSKAHTGTYPVTVEGGEAWVREYLNEISRVKAVMKTLDGTGALKRVDDVEFYGVGRTGSTQFDALRTQLEHWRMELAQLLGIEYGRGSAGAGSSASVY